MLRPIRVLMLSSYLRKGGAGRATWNIYRALKTVEQETGVVPHLHAIRGNSVDPNITTGFPDWSKFQTVLFRLRVFLSQIVPRAIFKPTHSSLHSTARVTTGVLKMIRPNNWDVVNLHWLGDSTMSIEEIGEIERPVVWTLHDMWFYSGAEHQSETKRFREGYTNHNRPPREFGPDINRLTWERKKEAWTKPHWVIAPSKWAAQNVNDAPWPSPRPIVEIPHPIDTDYWTPAPIDVGLIGGQISGKRLIKLGLGALPNSQGWGKGFSLIDSILDHLVASNEKRDAEWEILVFGAFSPRIQVSGIRVKYLGFLNDNDLRSFYRDIDVLLFPSINETFGLVAAEATSCGTPVVCFDETGAASIVSHKITGYAARKGDVRDFVDGIIWTTHSESRLKDLEIKCRQKACKVWSLDIVGRKYATFLRDVAVLQGNSSE